MEPTVTRPWVIVVAVKAKAIVAGKEGVLAETLTGNLVIALIAGVSKTLSWVAGGMITTPAPKTTDETPVMTVPIKSAVII